jgi:DNA-binding Lrp family transcriptional regulator
MAVEVDLIPLSQLPERYGIARSNLYNRLKDLKIESIKQGRKAFITASQLQMLDGLDAHLQQGGTTAEYMAKLSSSQSLTTVPTSQTEVYHPQSTEIVSEPTFTVQPSVLIGAIEAVVKRLIPINRSRLSYLRDLEEAYEKGWLLSTSEIADLLGLSPKTIANYGQEFTDAGFIFARVGMRKGGEIAWSVDKETSWAEPLPSPSKSIKAAFSEEFDP